MTFKELMDLVTVLKKTGYIEEELANIFVQICFVEKNTLFLHSMMVIGR